MGTARGLARVRREALAACMTCPLCRGLLREATAITLCLHTCEFPLPLSSSLPRDPGYLCPVRSLELSICVCLCPRPRRRRAWFPRRAPRLLAFASFVLVSDSSCSLVQMPPAIGLVSDANSLIPGGWRTRCLSRGLWSCLSSGAATRAVVATSRRVRVCFPVAGVAVGDWDLSGCRGFVPGAPGLGSSHVAVHLVFSLLVLDDPEVSRGAY